MTDPYFFGYGSLVNRATHSYPNAKRATVRGWGRRWKKTNLRKVAFLSVVQADDEVIDGLIAAVPGANWSALDEREWAYHRMPVADISHAHPPLDNIHIYRTKPEFDADPSDEHPILLSYIDVVVQGYLQEFGVEGAKRFFTTTRGWNMPILNDRSNPIYPRFQTLSADDTHFVDRQISAVAEVIFDAALCKEIRENRPKSEPASEAP